MVGALALLAGLAGCGDGAVPVGTAAEPAVGSAAEPAVGTAAEPQDSTAEPAGATVEPSDCDDGGDCVDGVVVAGRGYEVTCAAVAPSSLGEPVAGAGREPRFSEARSVVREAPELAVALRRTAPEADCGAGAEWTLAIAFAPVTTPEEAATAGRLRCEVPAAPDDHRCPDGGPFNWYGPGLGEDGYRSVWLDRVVDRVNADLAAGREVAAHASPVAAVVAEITPPPPHELWDDHVLRRVGVELVASAGGRAEVLAVYQEGVVYGDIGLAWSTQEERYEVEQLRGGPGWWVTGFSVASYSEPVADEAGRRAVDERWARCCDAVVLDLAA